MNQVFGSVYSGLYDSFYSEKDYVAECDAVESLFERLAPDGVRSVLDLGCGTGNHALELHKRGYEVVGVDRSEEMLEIARRKLHAADAPRFLRGDIRHVDVARRFDAVIAMFAVLGYQTTDVDLRATLENARLHLEPGGLFVFDAWYGPAVVRVGPGDRFRVFRQPGREVIRASSGELREQDRCCLVRIQVWDIEGDRVQGRTDEHHLMRYFFPDELDQLLNDSGFTLALLSSWPETDVQPSLETWNIVVVATAL